MRAYESAQEHLRDELWRVWLRVEHQLRCSREIGGGDGDELSAVLRTAWHEYTGAAPRARVDAGAQRVLEALRLHSQRTEARIAATLAAGRRLPLLELAERFGLSRRQRAVLCCALGPELDPNLLRAYRHVSQDAGCRGLDGRLLALLVYDTLETRAELHRDLSPSSPLIAAQLLDVGSERDPLLYRELRLSPRLLGWLGGGPEELDPQLLEIAELLPRPRPGVFPEELVAKAARALQTEGALLVVQGQRGVGKRLLARVAAAAAGQRVLLLSGRALWERGAEALRPLLRALLREARLLDAVPLIADADEAPRADGDADALPPLVAELLRGHPGAVAMTLLGERPPRVRGRAQVLLALGTPTRAERAVLWGRAAPGLSGADAEVLAERFAVPGGVIEGAARAVLAVGPARVEALSEAVADQLHHRLQRLGRRLEAAYSFDDLVVDEGVWETLWEVVARMRERRRIREEWGFRGPPGVSVIFSGESGVGKTMSATVLARELLLPVYEIDLSQVVSKWVGETEKNLAEVFDAAEAGHAVLLFNEADSLFGKRTAEVQSANDRYANMETNYLLQRLERFGGLSILTTNLSGAIDTAFRRRFAYDVQFPFPTAEMRAELWRRAFPPQARVEDLDLQELAERFELSGGFIKVAAERAAFLAAGSGGAIDLELLVHTVERMYQERGKLTATGQLR